MDIKDCRRLKKGGWLVDGFAASWNFVLDVLKFFKVGPGLVLSRRGRFWELSVDAERLPRGGGGGAVSGGTELEVVTAVSYDPGTGALSQTVQRVQLAALVGDPETRTVFTAAPLAAELTNLERMVAEE